ncbi:MAG: hypothetical protein NUV52_03695, partial [Candidatus Roizmanbacteria bacterium]|nr:hypothetical protein [Candidatus Roizmanbacteria bacterium]
MNDDLSPEELAQLEEEQKKKHLHGSPTGMWGALGAIGYFMYQNGTPEARRIQLQKAWKREYSKQLTQTHPELQKLSEAESNALNKYVDMMLVRADSALLQQTIPVTQLAHIHESIAQYAPEIASKLSPALLATSLSDMSGPYAQQSQQIDARLGEKKLQELRTAELKAETRTRMRETIRSAAPNLSSSEQDRLFERLDRALEKHGIHDVAQQVSSTYKDIPNENERLALSALHKALDQDGALTGIGAVAKPAEQTPLDTQRAAVFNRYAHDLEEKIASSIHQSGGGKDMLNPQRRTNESIAEYNNRIASAKALRDDIARFSKLSTQSRRDALFTANTPASERMGTMAAQRLLANFPQLKTLLSGALIFEHQNNLAANYASEYGQVMQQLEQNPPSLTAIRAHEDSDLLTQRYENELVKSGQSPEAIAAKKLAFKQAAQAELTTDRTAKNLMQRVEKRLRTASGDAYRDDGFAFNRTFAWYTTQPELQQRLQEQPRTVPPPSSTPLPRAMIEAVLKRVETTNGEETVTIRSSMPTPFPLQTRARGVFDRGLNAGARLADRFLSPRSMVKNAAQSALQKGAQQVAQRAAVAAAENPAT